MIVLTNYENDLACKLFEAYKRHTKGGASAMEKIGKLGTAGSSSKYEQKRYQYGYIEHVDIDAEIRRNQ